MTLEPALTEKPKKRRAQERIEKLSRENRILKRENQTLARQLEESLELNAYLTWRLRSRGLGITATHLTREGMN